MFSAGLPAGGSSLPAQPAWGGGRAGGDFRKRPGSKKYRFFIDFTEQIVDFERWGEREVTLPQLMMLDGTMMMMMMMMMLMMMMMMMMMHRIIISAWIRCIHPRVVKPLRGNLPKG